MKKIIASSSTKEGLTKLACEFFFNTKIELLDNGSVMSDIGKISGFKWIYKNKRYRLERD